MKKNEYRLNVRFDLSDEKQRRIAEALQKIDRKRYQSINAFVITAVGAYLDYLDGSDALTLEAVRAAIREEMRSISFVRTVSDETQKSDQTLTEEQRAENDASVLSALAMFG